MYEAYGPGRIVNSWGHKRISAMTGARKNISDFEIFRCWYKVSDETGL